MKLQKLLILGVLVLMLALPAMAADETNSTTDPINRLLPGDPMKFQEDQNPTFQKVASYPIDFLYYAFFWVSVVFTIYDFLRSRADVSMGDHETKKSAINSIFKGIGLFVGLIVVLKVVLPTLSSIITSV